MLAKAIVTWRLDWTGGSTSKLTHMVIGRLHSSSCGPLCRTAHDMAAGFTQSEWSERERSIARSRHIFNNQISQVTYHHICCIPVVITPTVIRCWEELPGGEGTILEAGCQSSVLFPTYCWIQFAYLLLPFFKSIFSSEIGLYFFFLSSLC